MTLIELSYFIETYQQKSISKAAQHFDVLSANISAAIKRLEKEFSVTLFHRFANHLTPTVAGDEFYHYALTIVSSAKQLKVAMGKYNPSFIIPNINIALDDFLMVNREILLKNLSQSYSNTTFSVTGIINRHTFSHTDFDISLERLYPSIAAKRLINLPEHYDTKHFSERKSFVWISKHSPLNAYKELSLDLLKNYHYITLLDRESVFSAVNFIEQQYNPFCYTEEELIAQLLDGSCYAFDNYTITNTHSLQFHNHKDLITKPLKESTFLYLTYNKNTAESFIPLISDFFLNK